MIDFVLAEGISVMVQKYISTNFTVFYSHETRKYLLPVILLRLLFQSTTTKKIFHQRPSSQNSDNWEASIDLVLQKYTLLMSLKNPLHEISFHFYLKLYRLPSAVSIVMLKN